MDGKMKQSNIKDNRKENWTSLASGRLHNQLQKRSLYFLKLQSLLSHLQIPSPIHTKTGVHEAIHSDHI